MYAEKKKKADWKKETKKTNSTGCLLYSCREADDWEEEAVYVEVFKHSLNWLTIYSERYAGGTQVQTAANDIVSS